MKLSDNQIRAKKEIEKINELFGENRWFIQEEIVGTGYSTIQALVNKGFLETRYFGDRDYYRVIKKPME